MTEPAFRDLGGHSTTIWDGVDRLIDVSPGLRDLQAHGLHLLAAQRWRSLGKRVPPDLARAELLAAFRTTEARRLLERIRAACEGPILLIKGPAVACCYPAPATRPFIDLDLLVTDVDAAQESLEAAGFDRVSVRSDPNTVHHLHPLQAAGSPLSIELHRYPKWIEGIAPPSLEELLVGAEAGPLGVEGILTLRPAYHALVLTAHLWAHDPCARLVRLLDILVLHDRVETEELERLLRPWALSRAWRETMAIAEPLFRDDRRRPWALRVCGPNLTSAREATVLETLISRCLSPFWVLPPRLALKASARVLVDCLRPQPYESWRSKLARTARQVWQPSTRRSEYHRGARASFMDPASSEDMTSHQP